MFERVSIRKKSLDSPESAFDLGFLAEAILFYDHVHVFADRNVLGQLIAAFGPELLIEYLRESAFTMTYAPNIIGCATQSNAHDFCLISVPNTHTLQNAAQILCVAATGKEGKGRRLARKLVDYVRESPIPNLVLEHGRLDVQDPAYLRSTVDHILAAYEPQYARPERVEFDAEWTSAGFVVKTNIDFASFGPRLTPALVLNQVAESRADMYLASEVPGEMALDAMRAAMVRSKMDAIGRRDRSAGALSSFNDLALDGLPDVRSVINSGRRDFRELLDLVRRARRFREWVANKSPDAALAKNYFQEITKESWLDNVAPKVVRACLGTAAGALFDLAVGGGIRGTATSLGLGLADTFLVDKLAKGWRPNQFIEGDLKMFLREKGAPR